MTTAEDDERINLDNLPDGLLSMISAQLHKHENILRSDSSDVSDISTILDCLKLLTKYVIISVVTVYLL